MNLIMISAMYENGGNVTHRHLDGHPELFVYPFESQPGTRFVSDELLSMFPFKYRWPVFPAEGDSASDFELLFDEEYKTRVRRPDGSKFRDADFQVDEKDRKKIFIEYMKDKPRTTGNLVLAWYHSSFAAWRNVKKTGQEKFFVGYSPIIGVDAERMFRDIPGSIMLHVVRNPFVCFSETCRRPFPLSLKRYIWTWNFVQYKALVFQKKFPKQFIIMRYEDLLMKKEETTRKLADQLGIKWNQSMLYPSWNAKKLDNVYPWGTIDFPDENEQQKRKSELTKDQIAEIKVISSIFAEKLGYDLDVDHAFQVAEAVTR